MRRLLSSRPCSPPAGRRAGIRLSLQACDCGEMSRLRQGHMQEGGRVSLTAHLTPSPAPGSARTLLACRSGPQQPHWIRLHSRPSTHGDAQNGSDRNSQDLSQRQGDPGPDPHGRLAGTCHTPGRLSATAAPCTPCLYNFQLPATDMMTLGNLVIFFKLQTRVFISRC